ncbi:endolytic transglycosylase MltG [Dysgonomonas termitidis]|uniref:Endolytic murein transglycosylase n=1 Tax=Dysgonomonas termitidis TaxID=1516126 RepID=A0ABV9KWI8_9BACT
MKKKILYAFIIIAIIAIAAGAYVYSIINTGFGIDKTVYLYIDGSRDYDALLKELEDSAKVKSINNFELLASVMDYKDNLKTGRYAVKPDMNILDLMRHLRSGHQTPLNLKFNNIRTKEDFAERISGQLMLGKEDLLATLNDPEKCKDLGFTTETIVAMFIPNTYQFYWDASSNEFFQRMKTEYNDFWNNKRVAQAEELGLSPAEVSTLASIVEEECTFTDEYPVVAGLYLNRLRSGQALQADPTVKFAVGDFSLRRILNKHLETDSPYNTYMHTGLPPGPIRIPSIKGIDSVLNYTKSDYLYMCAKEDFSGRHNFANTYAEHQKNAARYRNALNARGIY